MNIFRLIADMLHLISFMILIQKIRGTRNCLGKINLFFLIIIIIEFIYHINLNLSFFKKKNKGYHIKLRKFI